MSDRKKHNPALFQSLADPSQDPARQEFQPDRLYDDQDDGGSGVRRPLVLEKVPEPAAKNMQNAKEIRRHKNRVNHEFDQEWPQRWFLGLHH
jgi:hypothetical protein